MTSFWRNPIHWLLNMRKAEADNTSGWGPFRLPADAQWMDRASVLHDYDYARSDDFPNEKRESQSDWEWFWRCVLIASKEEDSLKRVRMAMQICKYFPILKHAGHYLWGPQ